MKKKKKNLSQQKLRHLPENDNSYLDTMKGTNSSNDRLILLQNMEINSNEYVSCDVFFREWNRRPDDQVAFKKNPKLSVITETVFGEMCRSATASLVSQMVNTNLEAQKLRLRQHRPFMSIKSFEWQDKVSFCSLIRFNWRVPARVPLFSLRLEGTSESHVATAGGCQRLLTHYRGREVRNSIYRYRKIHIDYRSKFSYRFISSISIIYGNTRDEVVILTHCSLGCGSHFKHIIFKLIIQDSSLGTHFEIALRWMPGNTFDVKSTLAQVKSSTKPLPEPMWTQIYVTTWCSVGN